MNFYLKLSRYKNLEIQINRFEEWTWFTFSAKLDRCCDHAGLHLWFEVLGFHFILDIYDCRHWNYNLNKWEKHEEDHKE